MNKGKICNIYTLTGIKNENAVKIHHLGVIDQYEEISDTRIASYEIMSNVYGIINACNISEHYLMSSKTYPILYIDIIYNKKIMTSSLFKICVSFNVETDIKSYKQLVGEKLIGNFIIEIAINNIKRKINSENTDIDKYPGNNQLIDKLKNFTKTDGMKNIIEDLIKDVQKKKMEEFTEYYNNFEIPKPTISLKNID